MKKKTVARGWAIEGRYGLYTGWWLTRPAAIAAHVHAFRRSSQLLAYAPGGHLTDLQRQEWRHRRSVGDRCVRIVISVDRAERARDQARVSRQQATPVPHVEPVAA